MKFLYALLLCVVFFSCKKQATITNVIPCNSSTAFKHAKIIRDVKNNYEINIGENWKRELYFDDYQSRIYAADTTRSFSSSFIVDVTCFKGKIILDEAFKNQLIANVKKQPKNYIIKEGFIELKELPGYFILSFENKHNTQIYTLTCYLTKGDDYYLLKSTINGSENLDNNLCESIAVFNSLNLLP